MRWGVEIISFPWGKAGAAKGVDAGPKEGKTAPPMRTLFPRVSLALSAALAVSALAPSALAITFDEAGVPAFDAKATVKISFDDPTGISGVTVGTGTSLEGKGYLVIKGGGGGGGGGGSRPSIPLTLPKEKKAYVARLFARKNRVVGSVGVEYTDGTPGFDAQFFPTGRVTSDGWYEIETARFSVDGTKDLKATLDMFGSNADVDAFELVPDGDFKALAACGLKTDAACGTGEYCAAGSCRNGNLQVPRLPQGDEKTKLVRYLGDRLKIFFGGRYTRENTLPTALATIANMNKAETGWAFWNGFATAIHQLRDWHTKIDGPVVVNGRGAFPICVVEGDADLSRALAPSTEGLPDVIVSHVGPEGASGLKAGDRIVAVNGIHPVLFAESMDDVDWQFWHSNDPSGHAEGLERLRYMMRRWAVDFTVIRCDKDAGTCSAPQTIKVADLPTVEPAVYPECDHRPTLPVAGRDAVTHQSGNIVVGPVLGTTADEAIYGMIWESVYLDGSATNPYAAPYANFRANAKGVLLDHRTGNGGTENASEFLTTLFRTPALLGAATGFNFTLGQFDAPFSEADGLRLFNLRKDSRSDGYNVGSSSARTDLKAALLLARDGSASDWFPEGMKDVGNVRVFGRRTAGAFSSFIQFDYYGGVSFQFGSGDYIRDTGRSHIGEGVLPDEDILPKQSDLVAGRDTVVERALQWLRQ